VCVCVCAIRAEGVMRTMAPDKLLKAMPALQTQVDTLLEFDVSNIWDLSLLVHTSHVLNVLFSPPRFILKT